jgi:hypothetical protein
MMNKITDKILTIIRGRRFYIFIIIFFIFEATWIALSAIYPQAFDEQFHFGLIKIYSHSNLPFISKQPAGASIFGEVPKDPSYLYHYLMSFPYRFIALFTSRQGLQVVLLRFINIAMFTYGIILFKKLLLRTNVSEALSNLALFIFILIPIVPQLAGQINYDNMLFPLVALSCLIAFRLIDEIKKHKPSFKTSALLASVCLVTSLVKYTFLPIFFGILCFISFYIFISNRRYLKKMWTYFGLSFKRLSTVLKVVLIAALVVSLGLFVQRDVANVIIYHSINPDCTKVISSSQCEQYSVFLANQQRHSQAVNSHIKASTNVLAYGGEWLYWMWYRMFFAINGPTSSFTNYPPLPLPSAAALIVGVVGIILVIKYRREIFNNNPYATLLLVACVVYTVALVAEGFSIYQFTDVLEDMNGRYLIPIILLAAAIMARGFSLALSKTVHLKIILACLIGLLFLEGGGVLTYIARSDNTWYVKNSKIVTVNNDAKKLTKKIVVSGHSTYTTSFWFFN